MKSKLTPNPTEIFESKIITAVVPHMPTSLQKTYVKRLLVDEPLLKAIDLYSEIEEIFPKLSDPMFHTDFVAIDIESLHGNSRANYFELIKTLNTLINCTVRTNAIGQTIARNTKIIASAGPDTDPKLIKQTAKLVNYVTIRGTGIWGYDDVREEIHDYLRGATGISKRIKEIIAIKKTKIKSRNPSQINLTPRQHQIYNLIVTRGASNKIIARTLNISESTVKLHTGALLKKYGVQNRTQLAAYAKDTGLV